MGGSPLSKGKKEVMKRLQDMTLEELWQLFPIDLSAPRPEWPDMAREEIAALSQLLSAFAPAINHIGSTAIPGIVAKPIVDILVEVTPPIDWATIITVMENAGYICMSRSDSRVSFNKGYTPAGYADKVFHIHFHFRGDNDEIRFRDYLTAHPDCAREYERLKLSLLPAYRNDRDGYTAAKSDFIRRILAEDNATTSSASSPEDN